MSAGRSQEDRIETALLHVDARVLFVDKAPFVLSQDAPGRERSATVQALATELLAQRGESGELHLVHRLDEETSGVLVLARDLETKKELEVLFRNHEILRVYHALVRGRPHPRTGTLRSRLAEENGIVRSVRHGGEPALTHYAMLEGEGDWSIVACRLETGRRNQIRVQFADRGHVLLGDRKYGDRRPHGVRRTMLHASALAFTLPSSGTSYEVVSPLPADFVSVIGEKRADRIRLAK